MIRGRFFSGKLLGGGESKVPKLAPQRTVISWRTRRFFYFGLRVPPRCTASLWVNSLARDAHTARRHSQPAAYRYGFLMLLYSCTIRYIENTINLRLPVQHCSSQNVQLYSSIVGPTVEILLVSESASAAYSGVRKKNFAGGAIRAGLSLSLTEIPVLHSCRSS